MATEKLSEKHEEKAFSSSASPTSKAVWKKATPKLKYRYKNQGQISHLLISIFLGKP